MGVFLVGECCYRLFNSRGDFLVRSCVRDDDDGYRSADDDNLYEVDTASQEALSAYLHTILLKL